MLLNFSGGFRIRYGNCWISFMKRESDIKSVLRIVLKGGVIMEKKISIMKMLMICIAVILSINETVRANGKQQVEQEEADNVKEDIRRELLEEYAGDVEFQRFVEMNPEGAEAYIDELVEDLFARMSDSDVSVQSSGGKGTDAYCTVPVKKQTKSNNCSAATILQTLCGLGIQNKVVGSTDSAKIDTIFNNYTTNKKAPGARTPNSPYTTLTVGEVTNYLNRFVSSYKYKFVLGEGLTSEKALGDLIWTSLLHNRPVLLHAKTGYLEYYGGHNSGHYLSVDWYCKTTGEVRIKDCNYQSYGGSHIEPLAKVYNSIHEEDNRYVIVGQ